MLEVLDARGQDGDNDKNFREDLHFYIPVCSNITLPIEEADHPWIHLYPMVAVRCVGALDHQDGLVNASCR